jgi:hypothetical protein
MGTTVANQPLNDTQMFVLQTFAAARDEREKEELTSFYLEYIQKKLNTATTQQEEAYMIFEPDEDFYNSISMEEVRDRLHRVVDKLYASK